MMENNNNNDRGRSNNAEGAGVLFGNDKDKGGWEGGGVEWK